MPVRIAVVQFEITHLDRPKNVERIEAFIKRATEASAQVIVFPEDCITGSIFGDVSKLDTNGSTRQTFQELARAYQIDIVTGSCMEGTPEGNFNTSYYIDAKGMVCGMYRKNHLYPSEKAFLSAGTEAVVFDTAYGKAGIVICWDMLFPELFQRLKAQDVQLIYCPSYWYEEIAESLAELNPLSEQKHLDALCLTRALETNAAVIYTNAAGVMRYENGTKDTLIGHSQITLPVLGSLQKIDSREEQIFIQEVDLSILEKSGQIYQA